jgi:hypothetical protein
VTLALLAPAQDILPGVEQTVEIFVASRVLGKATVVVGDEAGQKRVCRLDVLMPASLNSSDLFHAQFRMTDAVSPSGHRSECSDRARSSSSG